MNNFYHSRDWGFDTSFLNKKENARTFLNSIGLPCCIKGIFSLSETESFLDNNKNNEQYLIIAIDRNSLKQYGFFDITNFTQLYDSINLIKDNSFHCGRLSCCIISQLNPCPGCFTANIISDGKGKAIIEFLPGTVDNRYLSSGGKYQKTPQRINFNNYELVFCDDFHVLLQMWDYIKTCLFFRGYYECSYASISKEKNVYFSYYSNEKIYRNIELEYINISALKFRCVFLSLMLM